MNIQPSMIRAHNRTKSEVLAARPSAPESAGCELYCVDIGDPDGPARSLTVPWRKTRAITLYSVIGSRGHGSKRAKLASQLLQHRVELVQILVLDMQRAAAGRLVVDGHAQTEHVGQPPLQRARVGVL